MSKTFKLNDLTEQNIAFILYNSYKYINITEYDNTFFKNVRYSHAAITKKYIYV